MRFLKRNKNLSGSERKKIEMFFWKNPLIASHFDDEYGHKINDFSYDDFNKFIKKYMNTNRLTPIYM